MKGKEDGLVKIPEMDEFLGILQQGANLHAVNALSSSDSEAEEVTSTAEPHAEPPNISAAQVNAVARLLSSESPSSVFLKERQLLPTQTAHKLYSASEANTVVEACNNEMVTAARKMGANGAQIIPTQATIAAVCHLLTSPPFNTRWSPAAEMCLHSKLTNRACYLARKLK